MTTNPPEDEAKRVAREYLAKKVEEESLNWTHEDYECFEDKACPHCGHNAEHAHLAGQAVGEQRGYLRALEEVEKFMEEGAANQFWTLRDFISGPFRGFLKAKGGV